MSRSLLSGKEILVVEDEILISKRLSAYLQDQGASTTVANELKLAESYLQQQEFDFALLDINLPDGNGLDLLRKGAFSPSCGVVVITADGGVKGAVEAMQLGASEYLVKPFDFNELPIVFQKCRERLQQNRLLEYQREKELKFGDAFFFGSSLSDLETHLRKIIDTDVRLQKLLPPVLISGETGTGKSTIARLIHHRGPRANSPLIELNCSTLSESLAESELFGHEKGAFTDAKQSRIGLFEAAHNGTLFLDEISSLSPYLQAKLLTAIEDRQIRRVGGTRMIDIDVRIITASLHNLTQMVKEGSFREDLYHRLDLLRVHIPPLRERGKDIPVLAAFMLDNLKVRYGKEKLVISAKGEQTIKAYPWPGNVRELNHEIERALILEEGLTLEFNNLKDKVNVENGSKTEGAEWLNAYWQIPEEGFDLEVAINKLIHLALQQADNNVSAAARLLNVNRDYIRYRLKSKVQNG
jgi:two-component system response regulator AtoC